MSVTLEDRVITAKEFSSFLGLPNIKSLTIKQFTRWKATTRNENWLKPEPIKQSAVQKLEIHSHSLPLGPDVEYILGNLSQLRYFSWVIDDRLFRDYYWALRYHFHGVTDQISRALMPLSTSLVELNLLITKYPTHSGPTSLGNLDFSLFSKLKRLRIQADLLFCPYNHRDELASQLPCSLEELQVSLPH